MIERLLALRAVVNQMIDETSELKKYKLDDEEWLLLEEYSKILQVCLPFYSPWEGTVIQ